MIVVSSDVLTFPMIVVSPREHIYREDGPVISGWIKDVVRRELAGSRLIDATGRCFTILDMRPRKPPSLWTRLLNLRIEVELSLQPTGVMELEEVKAEAQRLIDVDWLSLVDDGREDESGEYVPTEETLKELETYKSRVRSAASISEIAQLF